MPGIFLSYRRSDAGGWAGRLSESLRRFLPGVDTFMDVDNIPPGVRFGDYIAQAVGSCDVLLVLIGPHWANADNLRRLGEPQDFVRLEIEAAMKRDIRVIPTRVGDTPLPAPTSLPESVRGLLDRQDFVISDRSWNDDCRRLASLLRPLVSRPAAEGAVSHRRSLLAGTAAAAGVCAAAVLGWRLLRNDAGERLAAAPAAGRVQPSAAVPDPPASAAATAPPFVTPEALLELRAEGTWTMVPIGKPEQAMQFRLAREGEELIVSAVGPDTGPHAGKVQRLGSVQRIKGGVMFVGDKPSSLRIGLRLRGARNVWALSLEERRTAADGADSYRLVGSGAFDVTAGLRRWTANLKSMDLQKPDQMTIEGVLYDDDSRLDLLVNLEENGKTSTMRYRLARL